MRASSFPILTLLSSLVLHGGIACNAKGHVQNYHPAVFGVLWIKDIIVSSQPWISRSSKGLDLKRSLKKYFTSTDPYHDISKQLRWHHPRCVSRTRRKGGGGEERRGEEKEQERRWTHTKSNNPHLTGGQKLEERVQLIWIWVAKAN